MKVIVSVDIDAPQQKVFEVVSDIDNAESRIDGIEKIEILSSQRSGLGLKWQETRTMFGKEATEIMEITEWSPPELYHVSAHSHGMDYDTDVTFKAVDSKTKVSMIFTGKPISLLAKLMTPLGLLFQGATKKALQKDLDDLKTYIESN